jgi:hypothetical protein
LAIDPICYGSEFIAQVMHIQNNMHDGGFWIPNGPGTSHTQKGAADDL